MRRGRQRKTDRSSDGNERRAGQGVFGDRGIHVEGFDFWNNKQKCLNKLKNKIKNIIFRYFKGSKSYHRSQAKPNI